MARRRKRGGSRKKGLRIAAGVGIAVGTYLLVKDVWTNRGNAQAAAGAAMRSLTGYNTLTGSFDIKDAKFLIPAVGGCVVSMVASKTGLNRYTPKGFNI